MQSLLEKYWDINVDDSFWYESLIEEFENQLTIAGFVDIKICFTGFYSQGDGLNFTGYCSHNYIESNRLSEIYYNSVLDFINLLKTKHCSFSIVKFSHHYEHENTVAVSSDLDTKLEEQLLEAARNIMQEFYRTLESGYNYLTSEEAVKETLIANNIAE